MVEATETVSDNAQIAKAYEDLLRISYQKLTAADKNDSAALDTLSMHTKTKEENRECHISFIQLQWPKLLPMI